MAMRHFLTNGMQFLFLYHKIKLTDSNFLKAQISNVYAHSHTSLTAAPAQEIYRM